MSSGNIRIVKFNEDLFKVPSRTQKRKKPDKPIKIKSAKQQSNKTIKNSILKEIRKNQEKKYNELLSEPKITADSLSKDFENDFKNSVDFMKKITEKHTETKLNQTIKNHNASVVEMPSYPVQNTNLIPVQLEPEPFAESPQFAQPQLFAQPPQFSQPQLFAQPPQFELQPFEELSYPTEPIKILPTPGYGCLKNGSLPTFRTYHNKTIKAGQPPPPLITERIKSPTELLLIEKIKQREIENKTKNQIVKQKKYKKLLRRTYRVGKDKYRPKVGVLLPNKTIRTNVTTKSYMLKQTPIDEIRKTLVKQGFIKVGSSAPNDVLQKIYESIKMIDGDINNHNPDNLLYNFFNENKS
jgi:hypothetical protein